MCTGQVQDGVQGHHGPSSPAASVPTTALVVSQRFWLQSLALAAELPPTHHAVVLGVVQFWQGIEYPIDGRYVTHIRPVAEFPHPSSFDFTMGNPMRADHALPTRILF